MSRRRKKSKLPEGWKQCPCGMRVPPQKKCPLCEHDGRYKRVAIVVDNWKLNTFTKVLFDSGYSFSHGDGLTRESKNIYVMTNDPKKLKQVVEECNRKCAASQN